MKKYGLRVLVIFWAIFVGIFSFWFLEFEVQSKSHSKEICNFYSEIQTEQNLILTNGKIEASFNGFGKIENRPTLKFSIRNNTDNFINYRALEKGRLPTTVKFKNEIINRIPGIVCRFEEEFSIKPTETLSLEVFADLLTFDSLNKNGDYEFGFFFYNTENHRIEGWTEPITILEKMKKDILKNAPDFFYPEKKEKLQMLSPKQLATFNNYK